MRKHSSRTHKSKEPRVTFSIPEDDYDARPIQENLPPNNDFSYDSQKPQKSSTSSLSSKFSKRWERVLSDESRYSYKYQEESQTPKASKDLSEIDDDSQSPASLESYNYENLQEEEVSDDLSDDLTRRINMIRSPSNQSAEAILQNINILYNRVHEICDKK